MLRFSMWWRNPLDSEQCRVEISCLIMMMTITMMIETTKTIKETTLNTAITKHNYIRELLMECFAILREHVVIQKLEIHPVTQLIMRSLCLELFSYQKWSSTIVDLVKLCSIQMEHKVNFCIERSKQIVFFLLITVSAFITLILLTDDCNIYM